MEVKQTWTAEHLSTGWAIVYDRTPGGKKNDDGTTSYAMRIPVLLMSDWLADPEQTAKDIAKEMNAFPDLLEALKKADLWTDEENDVGEWRPFARAAIAKAEGRS